MGLVFHPVLDGGTEREGFGDEALKNRWQGELFP